MSGSDDLSKSPGDFVPPKRRARYGGTHPRKFSQKYKELRPESFPDIHTHVAAQGRTPAGTHTPVLLEEVMQLLNPQIGEIVADCTLGYGGHAMEFLRRIGSSGKLVGLDVDAAQLARTRKRLLQAIEHSKSDLAVSWPNADRVHFAHSSFAGLRKVMTEAGLSGFDVVFADLGVSSMQIDDPERGFSYKFDGPLDMRMNARLPRTAKDIVADMPVGELIAALKSLADEPDAEPIADAIARQRAFLPITRTSQLVDLILKAKGLTQRAWRNRPAAHRSLQHPAARTFQALRMLVNDEIGSLTQFLRIVPHCLRPGGRAGVISFHSKEDALVQQAFSRGLSDGIFREISESPVRPTVAEVASNPRSRSAMFGWARAF